MDSAGIAAVLVAVIGAVQIIALAYIAKRQTAIATSVDGHLSKLVEASATPAELVARDEAET